MTFRPRDYQRRFVDGIKREWQEYQSVLLVSPTGTGKTVCFALLVAETQPKRALILARQRELIEQGKAQIESITGLSCDVEMANQKANDSIFGKSHAIIATVQTMMSGKETKRMQKFDPRDFGVLIIDEAHEAVADGTMKVIEYFKQNADIKILGVTATPDRADEVALGKVFESAPPDLVYEINDAINDGWLVPIDQYSVTVEGLDFSHVRTTAGDLNQGDLAQIMESERIIQGTVQPTLETMFDLKAGSLMDVPVEHWGQHLTDTGRKPRTTLVFTVSVRQAENLSDIFNRVIPGLSAWVCGETAKEKRGELVRDFKAGRIPVMVNCNCLSQGFDAPNVEVVVQAAPTKSRCRYAQRIGRGTRPLPGIVDPWQDAEERKVAIADSAKPCIAEGQRVLTDRGLVPIEDVTLEMKVWDGLDFVTHCGVIFRGIKRVITYAGLTATPDHEVYIHDKTSQSTIQETRQTFGQCASQQAPICVTGIGGKEIRKVDGYHRRDNSGEHKAWNAISSNRVRLWKQGVKGLFSVDRWSSWVSKMWRIIRSPRLAVKAMRFCEAEMLQSIKCGIPVLWRAGNKISIFKQPSNGPMDYGESRIESGIVTGSNRQQRTLRTGKSQVCHQVSSEQQPTRTENNSAGSCISDSASRGEIFSMSSEKIDREGDDVEGNLRKALWKKWRPWRSRSIQRTARVFDILNAGPRHRFTVEGLLVSNCLIVLDLVGNSGRHKLVSTADILGGNYDDAVVARAKKKSEESDEPVRMMEELEKAKEELEERKRLEEARKRKLVARARYTIRTVNPFDVLNITPVRTRGWDTGKTLSDKQRAVLKKQGIDPDSMPYAQAKQVLNEIFHRWNNRQCTFGQAKVLKKYGLDINVPMDQASAWIDAIAKNGWKKPDWLEVPVVEEPF